MLIISCILLVLLILYSVYLITYMCRSDINKHPLFALIGIILVACGANIGITIKYNMFLHAIGTTTLCSFVLINFLYQYYNKNFGLRHTMQDASLIIYILTIFFLNTSWLVQSIIYVILYFVGCYQFQEDIATG